MVSLSGCRQAKQQPMQIKIMTYNIHHGNPPDRPGEIALEPIIQLLKKENPDLVALQEVDRKTQRSDRVDQAEKIAISAGYDFYHFYKAIEFEDGEYGLAILSKFKPGQLKLHCLPGTEDIEPRILAIMEVMLPENQSIIFANTHLDHQSEASRLQQANRILEVTAEYSIPIILAGDLNAPEGSEPISMLERKFLKTCTDCEATFYNPNHGQAIDFIMTQQDDQIEVLQHRVLSNINYSDHYPVVAVLNIKIP